MTNLSYGPPNSQDNILVRGNKNGKMLSQILNNVERFMELYESKNNYFNRISTFMANYVNGQRKNSYDFMFILYGM